MGAEGVRIQGAIAILQRTGYLGIDESNHGGRPEIVVAVYSQLETDILATEKSLSKAVPRDSVRFLLQERDFSYILFPSEHIDLLGDHGVKIVAVAEFLQRYKGVQGLDRVILDGELRQRDIQEIKNIIYPLHMPRLRVEPYADETYPIVNAAHKIAGFLRRQYALQKKRLQADMMTEFMMTPDIERYAYLKERLGVRKGKEPFVNNPRRSQYHPTNNGNDHTTHR